MLPPKMHTTSHTQATPSAKSRLADHILTEGMMKGAVDVQAGLCGPAAPLSEGSGQFASKFSPRMKEVIADLALSGFSREPEVLVDAACILAVLSPREDELAILSAVFDARDRVSGRQTLQRLYEAGRITMADMSAFMSMENRMFPSLPGYEEVVEEAPSDKAPPTLRSRPPDPAARSKTKVSVTGGYTDPQGNSGYAFVATLVKDS